MHKARVILQLGSPLCIDSALRRLLIRIHVKGECRRVWQWCVRIGLLNWRCVFGGKVVQLFMSVICSSFSPLCIVAHFKMYTSEN